MRLSRTILPDLLPTAEESTIERAKQLIPIALKNSGNGPIYCMAFRNMQKVIIDGLQEHCCPEVFLPTPQDIAKKSKVGYRPCESDVALQFMQNSTWTFPQRFFYQDPTSLTACSFSETEEEMLQQTHEMMDVFKEIFQKLELKTFNIKDWYGKYSEIMACNNFGNETCFYSAAQKIGFRKNLFLYARDGLGESEESILQDMGITPEKFQEIQSTQLVSIKMLGKSSPDFVGFVSNKQKLSCFVVKYELDFKTIMNAILTNIGISSFIWPKAIAPFKVLLVCSPDQMEYATGIYEKLLEKGISVLFDDRDIPLAEKVEWAEQFGIYEKFILDYIDDVAFFC